MIGCLCGLVWTTPFSYIISLLVSYWYDVRHILVHPRVQVRYLEGNFTKRSVDPKMTPWVILFFYFGVLSLREICSVVTNLEELWSFVGFSTVVLLYLIGFMLRQFEISRLVGIRPYNFIISLASIAVFVSVFLIYPLGQSSWFFAPSFGVA